MGLQQPDCGFLILARAPLQGQDAVWRFLFQLRKLAHAPHFILEILWAVHNYFSLVGHGIPLPFRGRFFAGGGIRASGARVRIPAHQAAAANQIDLRHKADFDNAKREFAHKFAHNDRLFFLVIAYHVRLIVTPEIFARKSKKFPNFIYKLYLLDII